MISIDFGSDRDISCHGTSVGLYGRWGGGTYGSSFRTRRNLFGRARTILSARSDFSTYINHSNRAISFGDPEYGSFSLRGRRGPTYSRRIRDDEGHPPKPHRRPPYDSSEAEEEADPSMMRKRVVARNSTIPNTTMKAAACAKSSMVLRGL